MSEQDEQQSPKYVGIEVTVPTSIRCGESTILFPEATGWDISEESGRLSVRNEQNTSRQASLAEFAPQAWLRVARIPREATEDEMEDALQHYDDRDTPPLSVSERDAFRAGWSARGDRL